MSRYLGLLPFVGMVVLLYVSDQASQPPGWIDVADRARSLGATLLRDHPSVLNGDARSGIREALDEFSAANRTRWTMGSRRTSLTDEQIREGLADADQAAGRAARRMAAALDQIPTWLDWDGKDALQATLSMPFQKGVVLIRRKGADSAVPDFVRRDVDLRSGVRSVDLPPHEAFYGVLELVNPPEGRQRYQIPLGPSGKLDLSTEVLPKYSLQVEVHDESGRPTEAAIGLYSPAADFLVPDSALDFSLGGFRYDPVRYRSHANARFWPAGEEFSRCFFVQGRFTIDLPAGDYRLIAAKGPEFLPVNQTIQVHASGLQASVRLRRWTNMSARGWHSGDCHIHYARPDQSANQRLLLWTQAEDLRMGNILRMGDGRETYFEQYAFGKQGRFLHPRGAFVPGQEDPRTSVLGHTISLNLREPIRDVREGYYLYGSTFEEARRQGGLSGYAHVNTDSFLVHRDMTINIPRGKVDFAEICEFGDVVTDLYYEFLNLGFRLTAVAGSDAPWGGTVGDSRVYAFTGGSFDPDQWFEAVRRGRTFVTAGPMLEFTVDGHYPGDTLTPDKGARLLVRARAEAGYAADALGALEIVSNGEVIESAQPEKGKASLEFELPAESSRWLAARVKGAHTTPIYIRVDGGRHWNTSKAPALLEKRLRILDEVEALLGADANRIGVGRQPEWESPEAFRRGGEELRRMIGEARAEYRALQQELP